MTKSKPKAGIAAIKEILGENEDDLRASLAWLSAGGSGE